ncbi:MAG: ComEC/Rec2 family competence protein [Patescibacteria group bacterium]|jgi:ComEC/Rec2-related protein
MELRNLSPGRIAGWMMLAFVIAVGLHSFLPYQRGTDVVWIVLLSLTIVPLIWIRSRIVIAIFLVFFSFIFGLWRFESVPRPTIRRIEDRQFIVRKQDETSMFARMRHAMTARVHSVMPPDEATLVTGILYGEQDLSKLQRERFRSAGLMHIVAVSGSNVTVVVQFISLCALGLRFRRRNAFWVTSIALIVFVAFVGFSASVARAAFMGWFILLAREVGRLTTPSRLLLSAATVLLLLNPWQLRFDIGFALSFLAMWGLLEWAPIFERWLARLPNRFELRRTLAMTLAATLTTAPYLAWMFGRISLAGPMTNVLALPLIPFVMGWGMVAAVWGDLPGYVIVATPVTGLARLIDLIAGLAEKLPWLDRKADDVSLSIVFAIYLLLAYFVRRLRRKNDLSTEKRVVL